MSTPNNTINSDAQMLRCAPLLRAGYGERWALWHSNRSAFGPPLMEVVWTPLPSAVKLYRTDDSSPAIVPDRSRAYALAADYIAARSSLRDGE